MPDPVLRALILTKIPCDYQTAESRQNRITRIRAFTQNQTLKSKVASIPGLSSRGVPWLHTVHRSQAGPGLFTGWGQSCKRRNVQNLRRPRFETLGQNKSPVRPRMKGVGLQGAVDVFPPPQKLQPSKGVTSMDSCSREEYMSFIHLFIRPFHK